MAPIHGNCVCPTHFLLGGSTYLGTDRSLDEWPFAQFGRNFMALFMYGYVQSEIVIKAAAWLLAVDLRVRPSSIPAVQRCPSSSLIQFNPATESPTNRRVDRNQSRQLPVAGDLRLVDECRVLFRQKLDDSAAREKPPMSSVVRISASSL